MNVQQPTLAQLRDTYRGLPKRKHSAITGHPESCLIGYALNRSGTHEYSVIPDESDPMIRIDGDESDKTSIALDPTLNSLATYFDSFAYYGSSNVRPVTAGACVRIIERFARKEGIPL